MLQHLITYFNYLLYPISDILRMVISILILTTVTVCMLAYPLWSGYKVEAENILHPTPT
jgi:hypothetical protein